MAIKIRPARRQAIPLRVAFVGETNSGKTYSSVSLALHMAQELGLENEKVVVIDSEVVDSGEDSTGSCEKYCGDWCRCSDCQGHGIKLSGFSTILLSPKEQHPDDYCAALSVCKASEIPIVVIDSMSHEWEACLRVVDGIKARARNKWAEPWGEVTPIHDRFMRAVLTYPGHVIATLRGKEKYKTENRKVTSLGIQPIQKPGVLYEFDIGFFVENATAHVIKTRAAEIHGRSFDRPGLTLAKSLLLWAGGGHEEQSQAKAREAQEKGPEPPSRERGDQPREPGEQPARQPGSEARRLRSELIKLGKSPAAKEMPTHFLVELRFRFKEAGLDRAKLIALSGWATDKMHASQESEEPQPNPSNFDDPFSDPV